MVVVSGELDDVVGDATVLAAAAVENKGGVAVDEVDVEAAALTVADVVALAAVVVDDVAAGEEEDAGVPPTALDTNVSKSLPGFTAKTIPCWQ